MVSWLSQGAGPVWEIPAPAWGAIGAVAGAVLVFLASWLKDRREAKVDAGQLALEYARGLKEDVSRLEERVTTLEGERNAYRSHAHVLHEWGGHVETPERPRPIWPQTLAM